MGITTEVKVEGMSCGHCVAAVTEEVSAIEGVIAVEVDLDTGSVAISSDAPIEHGALAAAIDEAGYELVG